jgi:uncharacterized membrane protein YqjE
VSARPSVAPPATQGLLSALRAAGATLNELVRVRGALFAVELREEVERRRQMLVLAALGFAFLHTALLLVTLFVAVAFWDSHRIAAVGAMALIYLGCGAAALLRLRRDAAAAPAPFAATLGELERDLGGSRASP